MLNVMADSLEARKGEFATLETLDCGKPIAESEADIDFCVDILRYVTTLPPPLIHFICCLHGNSDGVHRPPFLS